MAPSLLTSQPVDVLAPAGSKSAKGRISQGRSACPCTIRYQIPLINDIVISIHVSARVYVTKVFL
jgi:hypothetical protein